MFRWVKKKFIAVKDRLHDVISDDDSIERDLIGSLGLQKAFCGDFSCAAVQGNQVVEDYIQVDNGSGLTFVGIYDGHGGHEAASYVADNLVQNITRIAQQSGALNAAVISEAFVATEEGFMGKVIESREVMPRIQACGTCCLAGFITSGTLGVAHLGDSRAVMGSLDANKKIVATRLTQDHNVNHEAIRDEVFAAHSEDPSVVVQDRDGVWRIKGAIEVSRSIGDAYMKRPDCAIGPGRLHSRAPVITAPVVRADPEVSFRFLMVADKFVIFASGGLWDLMTDQYAVNYVRNHVRTGIAKRLVRKALKRAAKRANMTYRQLMALNVGARRGRFDNISVVVTFLSLEEAADIPEVSMRSFANDAVSPFAYLVADMEMA